MLPLFRLLFTGVFVGLLLRLRQANVTSVNADLDSAFWLALALVAGLAAAATWAPVLGARVASPITDVLNDGTVMTDHSRLLRAIRWCERRGHRRLALLLCFWRGVLEPDLPGHFLIGLRQARPGSWLERVFAREVFRFSNVRAAMRAHDILRLRHDEDPGPHPHTEVNLALLSTERQDRPEPEPLPVPAAAPPPRPARNPAIRLFAGADQPAGTEPPPPSG
jgi:hypothetical protein